MNNSYQLWWSLCLVGALAGWCGQLKAASDGPEMAMLPDPVEWTVDIRPNEPGADVARTVPGGIVREQVSRSGSRRRIIMTSYNGKEAESWVLGQWLLMRHPLWPEGRYSPVPLADPTAQGMIADLPEVTEALKVALYKGEENYEGKKAHLFETPGEPKTKVWMDPRTRLPLALVTEKYTRKYKFESGRIAMPRPSAEVIEKAKLFNQRLDTDIEIPQ